jgi:hypothetical protein
MTVKAELADGRILEFPDGTDPAVIQSAVKRMVAPPPDSPMSLDPTQGMSGAQKFFAGAGKFVADVGRGAGQRLGMVSEQEVADARQRDQALMNTGMGKAGNIAGAIAGFAPTAMIPGANTLTGATLAGAAFGGLQPTVEGESALTNTAVGGALGLAGQAGSNALARALQGRTANLAATAARNAPMDETLARSVGAGYTVPPTQSHGGFLSKTLEALSGKYKTNQLAGIRNQEVTNRLAKQAIGLTDDVPLTEEAIKQIRTAAYNQGYQPIRSAGRIAADDVFRGQLDDAVSVFREAASDFPELIDDASIKLVDAVRKDSFDSKSAMSAIRVLRDKASAMYRAGENGGGKALRDAAEALEGQIERHLTGMGDDGVKMLDDFREARRLIAKTHSVEDAMKGSNVDATALARMLNRGSPLTAELDDIAKFSTSFPKVSRIPDAGDASPFTVLDFAYGGAMGAAGGAAGVGLAPAAALPLARVAARYGILSGPAQRQMAQRSYDPSVLARALMGRPGQTAVRSAPAALGVGELSN